MPQGICAHGSHSRERPVTLNPAPRRCVQCQRPFTPQRSTARYCGPTCRVTAWRIRSAPGRRAKAPALADPIA